MAQKSLKRIVHNKKIKKIKVTKKVNDKIFYNVVVTLTNNNTFVNVSYVTKFKNNKQSRTLVTTNGGLCGFTGSQKANPIANYTIGENIARKTKKLGINRISLFLKGHGKRKKQVLKGFLKYGFIVKTIKNITPVPFNGCRRKKQRRL